MWYMLHPTTLKVLAEATTKRSITRKGKRLSRKFNHHVILVEHREEGKPVRR